MKLLNHFKNFFGYRDKIDDDQLKSGTGYMINMADAIRTLEKRGYTENLVPKFDHLTCQNGQIALYPKEFFIDEILRFEVASDPDDNSILYAITCRDKNIKGIYVESYGVYHEELSEAMLERIKFCRANRNVPGCSGPTGEARP